MKILPAILLSLCFMMAFGQSNVPVYGPNAAPSLSISGTGGAGFIKEPAQSVAPTAPSAGNAQMYAFTTNGFTRFLQQNEAPTALTLGRDDSIICKNTSGATMLKGTIANVTGSTGNVPNISPAEADSISSLPAIGVVVDDIANNAFGEVMTVGIISGFDTSAFTTGAALYLSATVPGAFTQTRPSGTTNFVQAIATVLVSGVGNGSVKVAVAPALLNTETGTNAPTWTATLIKAQAFLPTVLYSAAGTALPSCVSGIAGQEAVVSDATAPTYLGTYASGGTVKAPVLCNGTAWVTY